MSFQISNNLTARMVKCYGCEVDREGINIPCRKHKTAISEEKFMHHMRL